jgi:diguanylate cyclase (GGDEF)-like protein
MKTAIASIYTSLLLLALTSTVDAVERKKKIMVLHSYHQGLEWTDNITKGIKGVFDPLHQLYEIHYEYLDTKRNASDRYMDEVSRFVSEKNRMTQYEVVIVSDNNALALFNKGVLKFIGNPAIIFCGINNYSKTLTDHLDRVTGIAETTDLQGTIDLIRTLHPDHERVLVVLDRTTTGNAIREEFKKFEDDYTGKLYFEFLRDFSLDEIPEILAHRKHDDTIYILTFNRDKNGNFISYTEGIQMFSRSSNSPIYGSWDFYLGKGIVGGSITSGYLQGAEAAKIALRVLQGYDIKKIEVLRESPTQYMFDFRILKKFGIDRSQLPEDSRVINAPPTTFEKYRNLLIGITGLSIVITSFLFMKYRQQRIVLKEKKLLAIELEEKVRERTLELEQANQKLRQLSNIDGLTQLHNRRYFDEMLHKETRRSHRSSSPIALLICDIDFFKKYNDTYGHLAGDDCIKIVAKTIQQNCKRVSDIVARYGGEEFAAILPNTSPEYARELAESVRKGVESQGIAHETSEVKDIVSISIGVASIIPEMQTTPSTLISIADKALYASKAAGRNRVTLFENQKME